MATSALKRQLSTNPLKELLSYGQSVWLDYVSRGPISSGDLDRLIEEDGLHGITSNPTIFEKAIAGGTDYREILGALRHRDYDARVLYEERKNVSCWITFRARLRIQTSGKSLQLETLAGPRKLSQLDRQ